MQEEQNLAISQLKKVFGDSGTERYSGFFLEEPNTQWRDENRIINVEEMRRTDSTIKGVLNAIKSPMLATEWRIEGGDDKQREFVEKCLFGMPQRTWKDFLREALSYLDFGHYCFEIIYGIIDGRIGVIDLAPRIPKSIQSWQLSDKSFGIVQYIRTDEVKTSKLEIPAEKLLILTNDKEGDDVTGQSVLRSAYKHYKYKDVLYRIQGIAAERHGVGVPTAYLPDGIGSAEKSKIEEMLGNLRSNEKSFLVIPWKKEDGEIEILTPKGNPQADAIDKAIEHHDRRMLMSVLAGFLGLGSDSTGSFALSKDQSSFFLKHVEDKASYISEQISRQVIKKMVNLSFGEQKEYPYLTFNKLGDIDFKEMSEVLKLLGESKIIQINDKVRKFVHTMFQLPELTDEDIDDEEKNNKIIEESKKKDEVNKNTEKEEKMTENLEDLPYKPFRELTMQEKRCNLEYLNEQFNDLQTSLEEEMKEMTQEDIEKFLKTAENKINAGDIVAIAMLGLLLRSKLKKIIDEKLVAAYEAGKKTAAKELDIERPATPLDQTQIKNLDVNDITDNYISEIEQIAKSNIKNGLSVGAAVAAIISTTRDKMNKISEKQIKNIAGTMIGQYVNRGRKQVFFQNIKRISKFQRSEVLDVRTCNMCMSLDKKVVAADDPIAQMDVVHSHCRGVWIPIFIIDEEQPEITNIPKSILDNFDLIDGRPTVNSFKQLKKPIK